MPVNTISKKNKSLEKSESFPKKVSKNFRKNRVFGWVLTINRRKF